MNTFDYVTFGIAVVGAVTGIIGTVLSVLQFWRELDRERVKLRVTVRWALSTVNPTAPFLAISVTNMSAFNVTIDEAGLFIEDGRSRAIHPHAVTTRGPLPQILEPRTQLSIHFPPDYLLDPKMKTATAAYVSTQCGTTVSVGAKDIPAMVAEAQRKG